MPTADGRAPRPGAGRRPIAGAGVGAQLSPTRQRRPEVARHTALRALLTAYDGDDWVERTEPACDDGPGEDDLPEFGTESCFAFDDDASIGAEIGEWARPRRLPEPRLTLWPASEDRISWDVSVPTVPSGSRRDLPAELAHRSFLEALARTLSAEFGTLVRATTRAEALLAVSSLTAVHLADRMRHYGEPDADPSKLSRCGHLLISLPCGLVSLDFLTWLGAKGGPGRAPQPAAAIAYAEGLAHLAAAAKGGTDLTPGVPGLVLPAAGDPRSGALRQRVCADLGLAGYEETLRKDAHPQVAALLSRPGVLREFQARLPVVADGPLTAALGVGPRGAWIRRLALAGCLDSAVYRTMRFSPALAGAA